jgi:hypothetical protein
MRKAARLVKKAGVKVRYFFVLGHYKEAVDTIREIMKFALGLNADALSFGLMLPNPGPQLRRMSEEGVGGLRILHNRWEDYQQFNYNCFELENLPLGGLKKWQANACFAFYLQHPFKEFSLLFNRSTHNYRLSGLLTITPRLTKNRLFS